MSDERAPYSIPPELKAELIHFFAEADRKNAERFESVKAEVRSERELRQRESQRLTALESWRDDASLEMREMSANFQSLKGSVDAMVEDGREQKTILREVREMLSKLQVSNKALWAMILAGGATAGGVAKALSVLFG